MWQIFIRVWFTYVTPGSHSWSGEYPRAKGPVLQSDVSPLHRMCVRQRHGVVDRGKTLHWESLNLNRKTIFFWAGTASLYPCWQCCRRLSLLTPGLRGTNTSLCAQHRQPQWLQSHSHCSKSGSWKLSAQLAC